jgi:hypothetical protein
MPVLRLSNQLTDVTSNGMSKPAFAVMQILMGRVSGVQELTGRVAIALLSTTDESLILHLQSSNTTSRLLVTRFSHRFIGFAAASSTALP